MASRLNAAFEAAAKLPPDQQEIFAEFLLAELKDDEEWRKAFATSPNSLSNLAREARAEYQQGKCEPLDDLGS